MIPVEVRYPARNVPTARQVGHPYGFLAEAWAFQRLRRVSRSVVLSTSGIGPLTESETHGVYTRDRQTTCDLQEFVS